MKLSPLYCLWTTLAISISLIIGGLKPENLTCLLVIGFLLFQILLRQVLITVLSQFSPRTRFIILGIILAAVVEGFHMISQPVFTSIRIGIETSLKTGIIYYGIDLLFTIPAYLVIFWVIWFLITRIQFSLWQYIIIIGLAQTLGDGGLIFFLNNPVMLFFLPYPMTNYHAINILPFVAIREHLEPQKSHIGYRFMAIPILILTYFICAVIIQVLGKQFGLK